MVLGILRGAQYPKKGGLQQDAIEALCQNVDKPLVFPLSNPTDKAEIIAEHAYEWSHGQAIFASGAPAHPVQRQLTGIVSPQAPGLAVQIMPRHHMLPLTVKVLIVSGVSGTRAFN